MRSVQGTGYTKWAIVKYEPADEVCGCDRRKPFEEMRWEELWDAALRIENLFLNTPLPGKLHETLYGAIIAREYGLPCVTGVPDAASVIETGDRLTVDGYLGIVTIHRDEG